MKKTPLFVFALLVVFFASVSKITPAFAGEYSFEAIKNGGFEDDPIAAGWSVSSGTPIGAWTGTTWHGGSRGAKLGIANSTQSASQEVTIPAGTSTATLSLWYAWSSSEYRTGYGTVTFGVYNISDPTENYCQKILDPGVNRSIMTWTWFSCDLTNLKEQKVLVQFSVTNAQSALLTTAYIDDTNLLIHAQESTPPVTTVKTSSVSPDGTNGYFKTPPTITLSATDEASGSGVASLWYKWDDGLMVSYTGPVVAPEGKHTLTAWSFDHASNMSALTSVYIMVDTKAPAVTAIGTPATPDGSSGYFRTQPGATLQITDETDGSGPGTAYYKIDGGTFAPYTAVPIILPQGAHTLTYYATDWAGNASPEKTAVFNVDLTDPYLMIDPASQVTAVSASPMKITGTAIDAGAGISTITANNVPATIDAQGRFTVRVPLRSGTNTITFVATDGSGRTITFRRTVALVQGKVLGATVTVPVVSTVRAKIINATNRKNFNQRVVLRGENFSKGARVWIGKREVRRVVYRSPSRLHVYIAMAGQPRGIWDITVANADGQSSTAWKALRVK